MMGSKRKFYRRVFYIEILSESSIPEETDLNEIYHNIVDGPWSGQIHCDEETEEEGKAMAQYLLKQGSSPDFFCLSEEGEDLEEVEDLDEE